MTVLVWHTATLDDVRSGDYTLHGNKPDNIELENNLMNAYFEDMTSPDNWREYPSGEDTVTCALIDCSEENHIYNSNTYYHDAQIKAGQEPSPINDEASLPGHPYHVPLFGDKPVQKERETSNLSIENFFKSKIFGGKE